MDFGKWKKSLLYRDIAEQEEDGNYLEGGSIDPLCFSFLPSFTSYSNI